VPFNPLLAESTLPYHLPPFAAIEEQHFFPAFEQGMAEQLAEVERIATNPQAPTFANTVEALERSGQLLRRTEAVFWTRTSSHATEAIREVESTVAPLLTHHRDTVLMDARLYDRLVRVEDTADADEAWLLEKYRSDFVRAGAELDDAGKARLRELNERLTTLATEFAQNLLAAAAASALVVQDAQQLDGLPPAQLDASRQPDGSHRLPLLNYTNQPALATLTDRGVRRRLFELSTQRAPENRTLAADMARLRATRADLLGFPSHAAYMVADQTAKTTEAVDDMLSRLVPAAMANADREAQMLSEHAGFAIEPWDWSFVAEEVRKQRFDLDDDELRPYFELEAVYRDGIFYAATALYGLTFAARPDLDGYLPEVAVFEVYDADGSGLGLFLLDPYARPTKRGGAWMHHLVDQSHLLGTRPVVANNLNLTKPADGPTLLAFDEVRTAFHEFGHALHGLLSDVRFPRVSGTSVPRDFVEFPSQVNEMWMTWPAVLANYARHHEAGTPVPAALIEQLEAAAAFNQGFATVEYLAATLLDWAWHTLPAGREVTDPERFERDALERFGIAHPLVPPRYRTQYFAHCFSTGVGGYSAGYYSYIWSEVLDADSVEWFKANGGLERANGDRFRATLLSVGGSRDVMDAFHEFRGHDPDITPLLARRGLATNP
jgi:peptidyl-dipeptidase Dcp